MSTFPLNVLWQYGFPSGHLKQSPKEKTRENLSAFNSWIEVSVKPGHVYMYYSHPPEFKLCNEPKTVLSEVD